MITTQQGSRPCSTTCTFAIRQNMENPGASLVALLPLEFCQSQHVRLKGLGIYFVCTSDTVPWTILAGSTSIGSACGSYVHIFRSLERSASEHRSSRRPLRSVQSSPGYLQVGQVPSNCTRQIPQTSSSGMSHRHEATACHCLIVTFISGRVDFNPRVEVIKKVEVDLRGGIVVESRVASRMKKNFQYRNAGAMKFLVT